MTTPSQPLLDTDILSAVMRKKPSATDQARSYLEVYRQFTLSVITRYEILRGLLAKGATKQPSAFDQLCAASQVSSPTDAIIVQEATIYADLHRRGELISDDDILIAATAITHGLAVATNNEAHSRRIRDLQLVTCIDQLCPNDVMLVQGKSETLGVARKRDAIGYCYPMGEGRQVSSEI